MLAFKSYPAHPLKVTPDCFSHQVLEECGHLTGEDGQVEEAGGHLIVVLGQVAVPQVLQDLNVLLLALHVRWTKHKHTLRACMAQWLKRPKTRNEDAPHARQDVRRCGQELHSHQLRNKQLPASKQTKRSSQGHLDLIITHIYTVCMYDVCTRVCTSDKK